MTQKKRIRLEFKDYSLGEYDIQEGIMEMQLPVTEYPKHEYELTDSLVSQQAPRIYFMIFTYDKRIMERDRFNNPIGEIEIFKFRGIRNEFNPSNRRRQ